MVKVMGYVDGLRMGAIRGWVLADYAGGQAVLVTCDGERVATIVADRLRPDLAARYAADPACGFAWWPEPEQCRSVTRRYGFIVLPFWLELPGSPCEAAFYNPAFGR